MIGAGSYLLGIALLAALVGSLALAAARIRRRLLPGWQGAPAHLVDAVLAIALLIWLAELLGTVGLLYGWLLVALAAIAAAGLTLLLPAQPAPPAGGVGEGGASPGEGFGGQLPDPPSAGSLRPEKRVAQEGPPSPGPSSAGRGMLDLVTVGVIALVFAHWGLTAHDALQRGIFNFDSLWYHMPFAVEMAQGHSVTALHHTETVLTNWFYPQNSELLHAVGILLVERDTLSLFLNFGWLALAFLAAWCVGRPYGRGHLCVIAAALILECHTLVVREPGAAKNDLVAAALLLAAIAILVNARVGRPQPAGWPIACAGLAVGLAAGTKFTALAMAAALSVAVIALAPGGRRLAAAGWWFLPALAGGGFWYLRNLLAAGNPLPQVERLGPLSLPHPETLQSGRPDHSIAHYATDTTVWSDYFGPGLEQAFGALWPLVVGAAVAGGMLALLRGGDRVLRWSGVVALFGLVAYLFTPLSASGAEGEPVGFAINIRFAIPALLAGIVLLPVALLGPASAAAERGGRRGDPQARRVDAWSWALLGALLLVMVATNRADAVLRDPDRVFAIPFAIAVVLVPAALLAARRRGRRRPAIAAGFALLALGAAAIGYPLQDDYLKDRFGPGTGIPGMSLNSAYHWAREVEDQRIGLAGTSAGFLGYGFYGTDLSNSVTYIGEEGPHGAFNAAPSCDRFRAAVNEADLDYLVTAPFLNFIHPERPIRSPETAWLRGEQAVVPFERSGPVTVWRLRGRLDPAACGPRNAPLREIPQQPPG